MDKFPLFNFLRCLIFCQVLALFSCFWIIYLQHQQNEAVDSNDILRNSPVIFVGGFPRSGTTLMRVMIDAHPDIRCGEETHVLPVFLTEHKAWLDLSNFTIKYKTEDTGISQTVLDNAISAFMSEIIVSHGEQAKRYCNKDPFLMSSALYVAHLYKKAKFIYMIRDGRSVVHSIIKNKVKISGFNTNNFTDSLSRWSKSADRHWNFCRRLGMSRCLPVWYEMLVQHPRMVMAKVLQFLEVPWHDNVMHHEDFIGTLVSVSESEYSTAQVASPIYTKSLKPFVGRLPVQLLLKNVTKIAPSISTFGYDTSPNPDYTRITIPSNYAKYYKKEKIKMK